jgi:hypothetical protein
MEGRGEEHSRVPERVLAGLIGEERRQGGVLAVAAAPGAGGHAVGRGGALAIALSSRGASGGLPRSEQRVNAAVRRPGLGRSARRGGSRRTTGPCANASTGWSRGGERGHGVQGHLGARGLGKEQPRGAPGGSDAEGGRRRARAPKKCRPALFEIRFLQKIE